MGDFEGVFFGVSGGQVDLIEDGNDFEVVFHGQIEVSQGLCLNALGGVDKQNCSLAGFECAGNLVGEIHVAGGVDHLHDNLLPFIWAGTGHPRQPHVLGLNGNAPLPLDIHIIEVLVAHIPRIHHIGILQNTVR